MARDCTEPRENSGTFDRGDRRHPPSRNENNARCYNCQKYGHLARDCNSGSSLTNSEKQEGCYVCGKDGHFARDCTEQKRDQGERKDIECHGCHEIGHMARNCPSTFLSISDRDNWFLSHWNLYLIIFTYQHPFLWCWIEDKDQWWRL